MCAEKSSIDQVSNGGAYNVWRGPLGMAAASRGVSSGILTEMHPELSRLERVDELDELLHASDRPLLLFKHSRTCGVSAEALDELVRHLSAKQDDVRYAMITVQTHRDLANVTTHRLGVRHETPQALLIHHGRVVWTASHFRVTAAAVDRAIAEHVGSHHN